MPQRTTVVVGAVDEGNRAQDFYPVLAYLRDTSSPSQRPLYNIIRDHMDERLAAAALLQHTYPGGLRSYELVILHDHLLKRFTISSTRETPSMDLFKALIGAR